jgi:uncharacterized protein YbjT (DUF2867 family)/uncharacterized protein YndB with AHSA1/START domain
MVSQDRLVLVTGATGYVGGRLVQRLLDNGYRVRVMGRDAARLQGRPWLDQVDVKQGDVLKPETLPEALEGVSDAYYLIHSMAGSSDFHKRDLVAARNFGHAAHETGVERLIYLGGLGNPDTNLSEHLRSRQQTGDALRECGVPVTEFRAAIIVGSGSVSFEMVRYLTEHLPVMICPHWVFTRVQPIAIRNVLDYLVAALEQPASAGEIVEIGGTDVLTYGHMILGYAHIRGLPRLLIPVPVLTPRLSSYWVHLVTPIPTNIARPLIDGLRNEVVVRDDKARRLFPTIQPFDYQTAVKLALENLNAGTVDTTWSDALSTSQGDTPTVMLKMQEGMINERRQLVVNAPPEDVYRVFSGLGGQRGWLFFDVLWDVRGLLDRLAGGVGMRRGRRDQDTVRVGDAVDFWRVEAVEPNRLLRLRAEMKVPGGAWLQFEAQPLDDGRTRLVQTAFFTPKGLSGLLYWYTLYSVHGVIFAGMIKKVAERAERLAGNLVTTG